MDLDGVAVLGRLAEVHDLLRVLGVVAEQAGTELGHEILPDEARQLGRPVHPVKRVGAEQGDVPARDARRLQLLEDGLDCHAADRPVRRDGGIVEGDGDGGAGRDQLADARQPEGYLEGLANRRARVLHRRQRGHLDVREEAGAIGQGGLEGAVAVGELELHRLASW